MIAWLQTIGIPTDEAETSITTCPGNIFFLQDDFIRKHWFLAELPPEKLEPTLAFAAKIRRDGKFRLLAWHLHRYCMFIPLSRFKGEEMPDLIPGLGIKSGMLYLLVALSLIPAYLSRAEREGFPVRYGEAGAKRIGSVLCFYAQLYDGAFGIRARNLAFQLHYLGTATWRIGRFDFQIRRTDGTFPVILRREGELLAFCPDGTPLTAAGDRAAKESVPARTATLQTDGTRLTGIPIDLHTGLAQSEPRTVDRNAGWEILAGPGDWTLYFHIPGGGGMTPERCRDSFREAREFFRQYAPDKDFRVIWSSSWIFNPVWRELLPGSNMAALIDRGKLFPTAAHTPNPGMYFVFGRHEGDPAEFPARNSVEKAVLRAYREHRLRACGFFLPTDQV